MALPPPPSALHRAALGAGTVGAFLHRAASLLNPRPTPTPTPTTTTTQGRLLPDAAQALLEDLVASGGACWLESSKRRCLVLWRKVRGFEFGP
jgi:hypothetical protein